MLVEVQSLRPRRGAVDAASWMIPTRKQFGAGGGANRLYIKVLKDCALLGECVEVRGSDGGVAREAEVAPSLIVGE